MAMPKSSAPIEHTPSPTPFQSRVYALLKEIPHGKVTTYKRLAEALGTRAYQAVGQALTRNPNPVVVPCHRVVKENGEIGGYAYGSEQKRRLLEAEDVAIRNGRIVDLEAVLFDFENQRA